MSCILAFMTEDNYRAVGEMNAAVAAPIGENQLEVESGGVEGESGSSDEESDGSSDMEEFVVLCLLHVYVFSCIFLFSWYGTTRRLAHGGRCGGPTLGGGGLDAIRAVHGRVCPQFAIGEVTHSIDPCRRI